MKKTILVVTGLILLSSGVGFAAGGEGAEHLAKLEKGDFAEREKAVVMLNRHKKKTLDKEVYATAADLLEKETERSRRAFDLLMEDKDAELPEELSYIKDEKRFGKYMERLGAIVSKSGDGSYLPLVLNNRLDPRSIVNFGDDAVDPVINILEDPGAGSHEKEYALRILGDMLRPKKDGYVAGGGKRNNIKEALKKSASGDDFSVARGSVKALRMSGDKDAKAFRPDMSKMKRSRYGKKK
ncbi:MAG: hypothetical protein RQ824_05110 [bacterium]|nr:hypothetical protein [bacterium]